MFRVICREKNYAVGISPCTTEPYDSITIHPHNFYAQLLAEAGIIGFSKSIALELGSRNIRSNVVAPGFIQTEMTDQLSEEIVNKWIEGIPLKRGGKTIDVANLCLFLSSDLSSFITGQVINVDGGMLT